MQIHPTWAASTTWKNGVVHHDDDVYELPSSTPGVAARLEVKPRLWGLLGSRVEAVDCQGQPLDAYRDWSGDLVARDPRTGLETVLDPSSQSITVGTPLVKQETRSSQYIHREEYFSACRQEVDREGNMRFVIGLHGEREITLPPAKAGTPPVTLQDDRSWSQVELRKGSAPVGYELSENKHGVQTRGETLRASVGSEGRLALIDEDGVTVSYEMFIHGLQHQQG